MLSLFENKTITFAQAPALLLEPDPDAELADIQRQVAAAQAQLTGSGKAHNGELVLQLNGRLESARRAVDAKNNRAHAERIANQTSAAEVKQAEYLAACSALGETLAAASVANDHAREILRQLQAEFPLAPAPQIWVWRELDGKHGRVLSWLKQLESLPGAALGPMASALLNGVPVPIVVDRANVANDWPTPLEEADLRAERIAWERTPERKRQPWGSIVASYRDERKQRAETMRKAQQSDEQAQLAKQVRA